MRAAKVSRVYPWVTVCVMGDLDGRTKLAAGREAEIFDWNGGSVLRLLRRGDGRAELEQESRAMAAVRAAGVRCPEPREVVEVDGRPGLVLERIEGADGLDEIAKHLWRLWGAAEALGFQHALIGRAEAPSELPPLREVLRRRVEHADVREQARSRALGNLDGLPDGDRVCHGDFHPGNLIWSDAGPVVIDWSNASRGDPSADHARSLLLLRIAALPPGTSLLLRLAAKASRGVLLRGYRRAYTSRLPVDPSALARWALPLAVARVEEGIVEEQAALDRHIARLLKR